MDKGVLAGDQLDQEDVGVVFERIGQGVDRATLGMTPPGASDRGADHEGDEARKHAIGHEQQAILRQEREHAIVQVGGFGGASQGPASLSLLDEDWPRGRVGFHPAALLAFAAVRSRRVCRALELVQQIQSPGVTEGEDLS